eukprot:TRINITY_DN3040_c0_g1_i3.p1 TRINITY_DN3040_c0_g1~~TRINITY_DN3040_c0_g1_i3.p1  ORF type:complete len:107 (-),score=12.80 TRINITY_DN3040_c0_g1_i3:439-759(-)
MGNTASGREGKSRYSDTRPVPDRKGGAQGRFKHTHSSESMGNGSPPDSPGSVARSPLMFTPQVSKLWSYCMFLKEKPEKELVCLSWLCNCLPTETVASDFRSASLL